MNRFCRLIGLIFATALRAAPLTPAEIAERQAQIRRNFFIDPVPALDARMRRALVPAAGVKAEAVSYATALGSRVPAILYLPDPLPKGRKLPAFIVVNGHGGDKYAWYAFATGVSFARGGAAVLTYDQAGEGERSATRQSGTRDHDKLKGDELLARRLAGLMITDVMQAVSFLAARPEVDAQRIGAGGYSMGSFVLALAGAVEPRLRACVLVGGGNLDPVGGYWDGSKPMCQGWPYQSLAFLDDRPAVLYALHAARGPLMIWNGRADTVVRMPATQDAFFDDLRARVVALRGGQAEGVFEYGFTADTSHRPYWLTLPVVRWLERQLDFANWTEDSLAAPAMVHVLEWAQRTGVVMDKLYATEEREGGTRVIATELPGFERESLSVFTPEEWEKNQATLSFEAWAARARAAR